MHQKLLGIGYNSSSGSQSMAGGIVARNLGGEINNCYNIGEVSVEGYYSYCGGIVGMCQTTSSLVYNCYNLGSVSISAATTERLGGVAGSNGTSSSNPAGTIRNCYCTSDTQYLNWEYSSSYVSKPAVIMTKDASILDLDLWIDDTYNLNDGYPILKWQLKVPIYAEAYLNETGDKIEVKIPYCKNNIKEVRDENGNTLNEDEQNKLYSIDATSGKHVYKVIDEKGNTKQLILNIEIIRNATDLCNFRDAVNNGNDFEGVTVIQTADIDLSSVCGKSVDADGNGIGDTEVSWTPIGTSSTPFTGIYNGNSYEIYNIYINKESGGGNSGLFGIISRATLKNIIAHGNITAINAWSVGGICGGINNSSKYTIITNCENYINTDAIGNTAGIVGCISNSSNIKISKCINYGNIIAEQYSSGGIVGCIATCSNIVIDKCCNYGYNVTKIGSAGGIVAATHSSSIEITNCYNKGTIRAIDNSAAGIIGNVYRENSTNNSFITIKNCYNAGIVKTTSNIGAIIGYIYSSSWYSSQNNYWETNLGYSYGIGNPSANTGTTGVNTATLKSYASNLGSAFTNDTTPNINNGYPILRWQVEEN